MIFVGYLLAALIAFLLYSGNGNSVEVNCAADWREPTAKVEVER